MFMSRFDQILFCNLFFNIYFLNVISSVIPAHTLLTFSVLVYITYMEGTVSQILVLGPSFHFMTKKGKLFEIIFNNIFNFA